MLVVLIDYQRSAKTLGVFSYAGERGGRGSGLLQGIRTFLATNGPLPQDNLTSLGVWGRYPDDDPQRSLLNGDSRAALVPFMAHR
jgi:hypothetical protein